MKMLFYYNHCETLGHTTRTLCIARHMKSLGHEVMVLQGGIPQSFAYGDGMDGIDIVDVPHPPYGREMFIADRRNRAGLRIGMNRMKERIRFISRSVSEFNPEMLITEYVPFGRPDENLCLYPLLRNLRKKRPGIRVCSSVGYPIFSMITTMKGESILRNSGLFDRIFIHTPPIEMEYAKNALDGSERGIYEKVFEKIGHKTVFTNYITDKKMSDPNVDLSKEYSLQNVGKAWKTGDFDLFPAGGGMVSALITESKPVKAIIEEMVS